MDSKTNVQDLKESVKEFCEKRDWGKYHGAKDLAIGVSTEASELLEIFRFKDEKEVEALFRRPVKRQKVAEELADVLYFLLRFSQKYKIDLSDALKSKMAENEKRYPLSKSRGSNKKYLEF